MKKFLQNTLIKIVFPLLFLVTGVVYAQPSVLFTGLNSTTPAPTNSRFALNDLGVFRQVRFQANQTASASSTGWAFHSGTPGSPNYNPCWRPYTGSNTLGVNGFIPTSFANGAKYNTGGGADGLLPAITSGNYYTFNVMENGSADSNMGLLETSYNPVDLVSQSVVLPLSATGTGTVSITTSAAPSSGEFVYMRYSLDNWVTSAYLAMTFTGNTGTAFIPCDPSPGSPVQYYFFSSNKTKAEIDADVITFATQNVFDIYTLNLLNNSGSNYSYTQPSTTGFTGVYNVPGSCYPTLASFITALNGGTVTGPVTVRVAAGYTETAPVGGFSITQTGTSANTITFVKDGIGANPTFTAPAQTSPSVTDAIFKIIGGDYITIDGFTMLERNFTPVAADTTPGSNTMTEFGVALFYLTSTNGAQNNTIRNCTIDLNRVYTNTFGVYSNSTTTATNMGTAALATTATGANSNLTIIANTITDVNQGIVVVGSTAAADQNDGLVIGGSVANANTITNYGTAASASGFNLVSGTMNGVFIRNTKNFTISNNTISSSNAVTGGNVRGIFINAFANAPTGTLNHNINNNNISVRSSSSGVLQGIIVENTTGNATTTLNINANDFNNFGHAVASSGAITFISNSQAVLTNSISNNTFTNMSVNSTGSVTFISNSTTAANNATKLVNSNSIITGFTKTGAGGTVTFITDNGSTVSGAISNCLNNNFSNVTLTGATAITGISYTDGGTAPSRTVTGNIINNLTTGAGAINVMNFTYWNGASSLASNSITNINGQSSIVGITLGSTVSTATSMSIDLNTINNLNSTGTGGVVTGISCSNTSSGINISNNTIHTLNSTSASNVQGILITGSNSTNVFRNKIYNISSSNASGFVYGINVTAGTLSTLYNNVIGDLRTPAANAANAIAGINISGGTTVNAFHNSVLLNATSSGALFGSSAISVSTTPNVTLRNNIFINNSGFAGTAVAAAYRRSSTTLTTYNAASDNNLFYAGTPGANNVLFFDGTNSDQTLAAFKTRMATRDQASQTENTTFQSTTGSDANFLRIAAGTTSYAESGAVLISTPNINTDYWGGTRPFTSPVNGGTGVDIGASEFDGIPSLVNCIAPVDQATAYVAGAVTSNSAAATFTAAASLPTGYLVITSQGAFVGSPVDGTSYSPGAALGNGAVIQSSASTSINAVGLPSNTVGTITIFSYNSGSCAGGPKYNLVSPLTGSNTTCAGPATLPVTNAISASGFTTNWTQAALGNAFTITYSVEVTTDAAYTLPIAGSPFTTTSLSQVISGLSPQTNYYWRVRANNTICDSAYLNGGLVTTDCVAITTFPSVEPFASYLPTTCWKEGDLGDLTAGPSLVNATASSWDVDGFLNSGTTGAARINIFDAPDSDWLLTPFYTIPATGYRVKYNVGATNYDLVTAVTNWEADDFVQLLVSTSNTNWTVLRTYNSANVPSNLGQVDESDLSAYNGQTVRFAFRSVEGATNGAADIDFFVDNFTVEVAPVAITVSPSVTICAGDPTTLTVSSANTNYAYTWSPATGLNTTTGNTVIATPSTTTVYTVNAVDGAMNNTGTVTVTVNAKPAASTAASNSPICEGADLNLTASTVVLSGYSVNGNSGVAFTDISTTGTAVTGAADDSEHNITIPSFTYNGVAYTTARIGNNGVVVFGTTSGDIIYTNSALPQGIASGATATSGIITGTGNSLAAICANWDDMTPSATDLPSNIYTQNTGGFYIIQWNKEDNFGATGTGTITFQIQLEIATGKINLVYPDITYGVAGFDGGQTATVGLNFSATSAQQYSFNTASLVNNQSITFTPNSVNYSWTGPNSFTSSVQNPTITTATPAASGTYTLTVTNPETGCFSTSTATITVNPTITTTFNQVASICSGDTFTLPNTSIEGVTGTWSPALDNTTTTTYTFLPTSGQCATTATMTVVVGTTTTWTAGTPNFWSNGAPTSTSAVIISTTYSEATNIDACTLTINNNAVVTIPSGTNVNIQGVITVTPGSTMTLNNNANLIQSRDVSNFGNISVKRQSALINRLDYTLWSSPVDGQMLQAFSPGTVSDRFYTFNPTLTPAGGSAGQGAFQVVSSPSTTAFAEGNGYLIRASNWTPSVPAPAVNWMGTFTGIPNNGDVTIPTTSGSWYAIGNPYPSTIDADEFITANNLTQPLYFWRKVNGSANPSYATYTLVGQTGVGSPNTAGGSTITPDGIIATGQGFLTQATSSSLVFTNALRNGDFSTQFLRTASNNRSRVWLNLSNNEGFVNQMLVGYMATATTGIDAAMDGRFYENNIPTQLSSLINGEEFAVQGRPVFTASDIVALGFKTQTDGNYTIAIDHVDGLFADGQEVFLKDNMTNTVHNLTNAPYNFVASTGTTNTRFEIVYESTLSTENPILNENNIVAYTKDTNLIVNSGKAIMKEVKVYDVQGRLLVEKNNINATETKLSISDVNQVLIVKVTTNENLVITKKIIN